MDTSIKIANDLEEMVQIGKTLFKEKQSVYNNQTCITLNNAIERFLVGASEEEKSNAFFRSIYDYWVYGNSISEEFYYYFSRKSHIEKLSYLTERSRYQYYYYLNKKTDLHLVDNKFEAYSTLRDFYKREIIEICTNEDFDKFKEFAKRHNSFVVKPVDSNSGS